MKARHFISILLAGILTFCIAFPVMADDYSMLGLYTKDGYENEYFNYQLKLPEGNWTIESRAPLTLADSNPVEESNKENTLSFLKTSLDFSHATGFSASSDTDFVSIIIQSPGLFNDKWADEKTIAETSFESVIDELESVSEDNEDVTVTQINGQVDYVDSFIDGKHYCCVYDYLLNGIPFYGIQIYVRSDDGDYLSVIDLQSFYPERVEELSKCFTKLK